MSPALDFHDRTVCVPGRSWAVQHPVADARLVDDRVLVIYDYIRWPADAASNLDAFDLCGQILWTAENPNRYPADAYVEFVSTVPLVVWNFACFVCTINPATGRLIEACWTK